MENKKIYFTKTILCMMLIAILTGCLALCTIGTTANAATTDSSPDAETLGLMTKLSLDMGSSEGKVWATVHNDFTLGMSTVEVYVELYSSLTYQSSYKDMTLESQNHIGDLNINKTLRTTAPIDGVQRYWRARMRYKVDKKDWATKETATVLVDVNGKVVK